MPALQPVEQAFLTKITYPDRRMEWLASRVLLYRLTGMYPATRYNDNGQPFVSSCHENISISHTRGYAAIALSKKTMPGIDIEYPSERIEKVAPRFLNDSEKAFTGGSVKNQQLGLIWCAKEALYKKAGHPGLIFKDQIVLAPFKPAKSGILMATVKINDISTTINLGYQIDKNYFLVWTA